MHSGAVIFNSRQARILGEPLDTPMISYCFTAAPARGKGLYRRALAAVVSKLGALGYPHVVIETFPRNVASRRGIEAAGFQLAYTIKALILFNTIVMAVKTHGSRRRFGMWVA